MNPETVIMILRMVDLLASAVIRSTAVQAEFSSLRNQISEMVAEGRGPTPAEWTSMNERADALHRELQGEG